MYKTNAICNHRLSNNLMLATYGWLTERTVTGYRSGLIDLSLSPIAAGSFLRLAADSVISTGQ